MDMYVQLAKVKPHQQAINLVNPPTSAHHIQRHF